MKADCHIHMLLDGEYWKTAIDGHRNGPDVLLIRKRLRQYADAGFTYLRDGGDRWGVGAAARELAGEYGIIYRTPLANLCHKGHYGGFIGWNYENLKEYAQLVEQTRKNGGDFIKIMISGIMDFDCFGKLSEHGLAPEVIRELIHIAHEEGFAVMAHANGARTVEAAALAGVDSVEHGAYLDEDALHAMQENGVIWCPTLSAIANLVGKGRFSDEQVGKICESTANHLRRYAAMGGIIAPGSDAGAWAVPHCQGGLDEYRHLSAVLGGDSGKILDRGIQCVMDKF